MRGAKGEKSVGERFSLSRRKKKDVYQEKSKKQLNCELKGRCLTSTLGGRTERRKNVL